MKYSSIDFKFCLGTLCTYSLIVYFELITSPCINLMSYLCITIANHYYMHLIVETHSALRLLLSSDNLYIHSGRSLEY